MSANKAVHDNDIPVTALKENANFLAEQITLQFNEGICSSKYAESFKLANTTPAFKQGSRNLKNNHRPISILPIISKIFEKFTCNQLSIHFDNIFSKFQCGFRKRFGAQHCLLLMIDKWKKSVDSNKVLVQFLLINQNLLTVLVMIFELQNCKLMDCLFMLWKWFKIIFLIENKEQKLDPHKVHGTILYLVFLRDRF